MNSRARKNQHIPFLRWLRKKFAPKITTPIHSYARHAFEKILSQQLLRPTEIPRFRTPAEIIKIITLELANLNKRSLTNLLRLSRPSIVLYIKRARVFQGHTSASPRHLSVLRGLILNSKGEGVGVEPGKWGTMGEEMIFTSFFFFFLFHVGLLLNWHPEISLCGIPTNAYRGNFTFRGFWRF